MRAALCAHVLFAAFCGLLAFATSASAECAWVLWDGSLFKGEWSWGVPSAYPTMKECSENLLTMAGLYKGDSFEVKGAFHGSREASYRKKGDDTRNKLVCLPDTVDPRGPKGK